jgi:hypothetical protein
VSHWHLAGFKCFPYFPCSLFFLQCLICYYSHECVCVCGARNQTQRLLHARQALYHWAISLSPTDFAFQTCFLFLETSFRSYIFCLFFSHV